MMYAIYKRPGGGKIYIAYSQASRKYLFAISEKGRTGKYAVKEYNNAKKAQRELDYYADTHNLKFICKQNRIEEIFLNDRGAEDE